MSFAHCNFCGYQVFLHVSTTYSNLDKHVIEEKVYASPLDPQKLMDLVDSMDDRLLTSITKQQFLFQHLRTLAQKRTKLIFIFNIRLLGNTCPNVYSYSKALCEHLLKTECKAHGIPLAIVRPSIVSAAINEPLPGWVDNMNGATGELIKQMSQIFDRSTNTKIIRTLT